MTRKSFQDLAHRRIREARVLYAARQYSGAYYLAGYAVECALKAAICKTIRKHHFPDKDSSKLYTHNLKDLKTKAAFTDWDTSVAADPQLEVNWNNILLWNESTRYSRTKSVTARDLIASIDGGPSSFLQWVATRW